MKFLSIFNEFNAGEAGTASRAFGRREALGNLGRGLGQAAAIGLPLAAFLKPGNLRAQSSGSSVVDVLNFALTLEYLESEYYATGLSMNGLLTGDMRQTVALISEHEAAHVEFLRSAISGSGGTPVSSPNFDFTAGGNFPDVFSNPATFLAIAQAFEDTGVRAYKGQAANLMGSGDVLTAALQIHSIEARHASEIRRMRGSKGWITNAMHTTGVPAVDDVYAGEDNVTHLGVDATTVTQVDRAQVTEAYDEPLSRGDVLDIASLFISA